MMKPACRQAGLNDEVARPATMECGGADAAFPAVHGKCLMLPYQEFFYRFDDLPDEASAGQICLACRDPLRRQHAFWHFWQRHPDDVTYLHGYLAAYVENGVYDQGQFTQCFELIDSGLQLRDSSGCHSELRAIKADLECQQADFLAEGRPGPGDQDSPWSRFRRRDFGPIEARCRELETTVVPRGILGPPEEMEYWHLLQFMIRIALVRGDVKQALAHLRQYEKGRIAVKLTPMPDFDIQEAILGYYATHSVRKAVKRLRFWIQNSRMPIVSALIKNHPAFAHLLEPLKR